MGSVASSGRRDSSSRAAQLSLNAETCRYLRHLAKSKGFGTKGFETERSVIGWDCGDAGGRISALVRLTGQWSSGDGTAVPSPKIE